MTLITATVRRRSLTSRRCKPNTWGVDMYTTRTLLVATSLTLAASAMAVPVTSFAPDSVARAIDTIGQPDESGLILVQNRGRGGGGGQRSAGAASRGGGNFNSND